jgi:hypothetical protein
MRLVALILLLLFASPGSAQVSPFEFNGVALGSDLASIERTARFSCTEPRSPVADQVCRLKSGEREAIANAPVKGLLLYFYARKLEMITLTLDPKHFTEVVGALTKQYGSGSLETESIQNVTGATFENKIYSWRRNKATLEAQTYGRNLETSSVIYRTDFSLEEYTRRSAAKPAGR